MSTCAVFNFHTCCACGQSGPLVCNIVMLNLLSPTPGLGWGCLTCGLSPDGALAVICDDCLKSGAELKFVCTGYPTQPERTPLSELRPGQFEHILHLHPEVNQALYGLPYPN